MKRGWFDVGGVLTAWRPKGGGQSYRQRVLGVRRANLVAYWPLGEAAGSVAADASGQGRNGAYVGVDFNRPGVNLLVNGGFETAGAGGADVFGSWAESVNGGAIVDEVVLTHGGGHALELSQGVGASAYIGQSVAVLPGIAYRLSFWARGDGSQAGRYYVYDNSNWGAIIAATSTGIIGEDYGQVTVTFSAPAGCSSVLVRLYCPAAEGGVAYFDDVSLVAASANGVGDGGNAPFFDGVNDFCNVYSAGLAGAFNGAEGTLMAWAKVAAAGVWADGQGRYLAYMYVDESNRVSLAKNGVNDVVTLAYNAGGVNMACNSACVLTSWFQMAMTWSKSADQVKGYVNGAQVDTTKTGLGVWVGALNPVAVNVGAATTQPVSVWHGALAHAALWNVALTAGEIAALAKV